MIWSQVPVLRGTWGLRALVPYFECALTELYFEEERKRQNSMSSITRGRVSVGSTRRFYIEIMDGNDSSCDSFLLYLTPRILHHTSPSPHSWETVQTILLRRGYCTLLANTKQRRSFSFPFSSQSASSLDHVRPSLTAISGLQASQRGSINPAAGTDLMGTKSYRYMQLQIRSTCTNPPPQRPCAGATHRVSNSTAESISRTCWRDNCRAVPYGRTIP
ncbi:hypothetical protein J3E68DRAFT_53487 [Trichoderma sp. SZMC 28012]